MSGLESYAHRAAKQIMAEWLREAAAEAGHDNYVSFGPLTWRVNRSGPSWGVWTEYPFMPSDDGTDAVWDETGLPGCAGYLQDGPWRKRPPTFDECIQYYGSAPKWIVDIAVQHKGYIAAVVEIVHKNPPSQAKLHALSGIVSGGEVLVIPARWVLGQVRRPVSIPSEFAATSIKPAWA